MLQRNFFDNLSEDKIKDSIKKEGFNPIRFSNGSGDIYHEHKHPETKLLAFLKGSMEVKVGNETFQCKPKDKIIIPGNTKHSAVIGPDGCEFFWSEKLI